MAEVWMSSAHVPLQVEEDGYASWGGASPIVTIADISKATAEALLVEGHGLEGSRALMLKRALKLAVLDGTNLVAAGQLQAVIELHRGITGG